MSASLHIETAAAFFGDTRPPALPADREAPDYDWLVRRIHEIDASRHPFAELKELLVREHTRLGAGPAVTAMVNSIGPDTLFVVAGQQAGLFGGPLYTLFKAMHAAGLAKRLSKDTGRMVTPLFWVASDDHDFEEVNRLGIVTPDDSASTLSAAPADYREGMPVGDIVLDGSISEALESLARHTGRGNMAERYISMLGDCWQPGRRWNDAFARQMLAMFARQGIVMFDPRWDGAKALMRDVMRTELSAPLASTERLNSAADDLGSAGERKKALRKPSDSTNLFLEIDGIRLPIHVGETHFTAGDKTFGLEELSGLLDTAPHLFSPGAAIRPVCQDALFPVVAQIAGPGEQRYLGQLDSIYPLFGVSRSIPWPRASFTIFDHRTIRNAEKEHAALSSLFADIEKIRIDMARDSFPPALKKALDTLEQSIAGQFDTLTGELAGLDPTLAEGAEKDKGRILHTLNGIRDRAVRAHKKQTSVSESRLSAASFFLLPNGMPQERWFGYDAVLTVLDDGAFDELAGSCTPGEESHRIVMPAAEAE